jgi:GDP-L-fucose synthase
LIRKFHAAKINGAPAVELWGDGSPLREFLHVDDLAAACVHLMENYDGRQFVNVGTGEDLAIKDLAEIVKSIIGFEGSISWDSTKPNGTPRKLMNVDRIHSLGWKHKIELRDGISSVYELFKSMNIPTE